MSQYPSPQPQPLVFPFAAVTRAARACDAVADELRALEQCLGDAYATACAGFEGATRRQTEAELREIGEELDWLRRRLREQAAAAGDAHDQGRRAQQARQEEIAEWRRREAAWRHQQEASR